MMTPTDLLYTSIAFFLIAIPTLVWFYFRRRARILKELDKDGVRTRAVVIQVKDAVVTYRYKDPFLGVPYERSGKLRADQSPPQVGESITVIYDPSRSSFSRLRDERRCNFS